MQQEKNHLLSKIWHAEVKFKNAKFLVENVCFVAFHFKNTAI